MVDEAGLLSPADRDALEHLARTTRAQDDGNGVQLGFLLVPSLQGEPIEDFSIRVAERWKLGTKGPDNGLLFVVARDDHQMRIEVGGGLEGKLPDVLAGRIVDGTLRPAFREGRYGPGLLEGAAEALAAIGGQTQAVPSGLSARRLLTDNGQLLAYLAFFLLISLLGGRRRRGFWFGGGGWSGGWSGGGGGGGWSGGGGGFSGGGASGSW
ncbi:MAG: TPM domain-containing protein [Myxococcales bacterium]